MLKCLYWCTKEAVFKLVEEEGEFREQIIVSQKSENENQFQARFITTPEKNTDYLVNFEYFSENCMVWVVE